jgi:hypothetical protein
MQPAVDVARRPARRKRLERQTRSGLSLVEFCRREQVSVQNFKDWKRLLASASAARQQAAFVPLRIVQPPASSKAWHCWASRSR